MAFLDVFLGAGLALLATSLGAAGVFPLKCMNRHMRSVLLSFCAGVMLFSAGEMLISSHALAGDMMAFTGLLAGLLAFFVIERILPHAHMAIRGRELEHSKKKAALLAGTITIHNIPEGFAIASAFAAANPLGWLVALSISLQDIPEGFVISAPLACYGLAKARAFWWGVLSGLVEFGAAIVGYILLSTVSSATPIALAFSAGAMTYVVVFELLLDALMSKSRCAALLFFIAGLAVAFGLATLLTF